MRNKLQYAYSICVFAGVLATSYMMMNREGSSRLPFNFSPSNDIKSQGSVIDPAVSNLFEIEKALNKQQEQGEQENAKAKAKSQQRMPTEKLPQN